MTDKLKIDCAGETLQLLSDYAIYWPGMSSLIIADPHFGKPSAYRNAGIPVPTGTTSADLARLSKLIRTTGAERLMVLGDFFHHKSGQCERTMDSLFDWRRVHSNLEILIVMGNHDSHSHPPPPEWQVQYEKKPITLGPYLLCHEPCTSTKHYVLSGHIHPAITLRDPVGPGLRVPCFIFRKGYALLPAFGGFTGTASVRPVSGDRVFGIVDHSIIQIPVRSSVRA